MNNENGGIRLAQAHTIYCGLSKFQRVKIIIM